MGREARKYGKNTVKPGFGQGPPGHGGREEGQSKMVGRRLWGRMESEMGREKE